MFVYLQKNTQKKKKMNKININSFFSPINKPKIDDNLIDKMKNSMDIIDRMACILNQSLYVIDYLKQNFIYISPNKLFLCGYTMEQVKKWGYSFYTKVIPEVDLNRLLDINKARFDFYYKLPIDKRYLYTIEYDFDLININKKVTRVNQRLIPLIINEYGDLWLALCIVTPSYSKEKNKTIIKSIHTGEQLIYQAKIKSWYKNILQPLTVKEKQILQFSSEGYTNTDIAKKLSLNINTIKFHKRNIYQKLDVKNCVQAISVASHWGLL
ncbi:helix-turn-helix transcriptional regulator [Parabacteroides sp. BX2]|uniref:Helix-turn-helix transcriptional regulator n=2 Tax=Tannerellaceae TaxID=2005525 RepID=A0ABR7E136_9BACT|nr:helix-turn-helix transcriptional regulator [Parabacteroides segnis]